MTFKTIHTTYGLTAMAQAEATGVPISLTHMAVGDGGGNAVTPIEYQTELAGEVFRAKVNRVYQDSADPKRFTAEFVVPAGVPGFTMREVGVFDSTGALYLIANMPDTYKPQSAQGAYGDTVVRVEFVVTDADTVLVKLVGGAWERVAKHNTEGMVRCIYRTTGTDTTYRRTDAMVLTDPAATTFTDNVASKDLSIPLDTIEINRPPKYGHSLVILPNNSMAMWSGKELCLSESGKPHSWPTSLRYAQPSDGVALAVAGNGVILLTEDKVRYATVPTAESVSFDNIGTARCASKRGVAPIDGGCIFPAIDGWYVASSSAISKISDGVFRQQEWDATTPTSHVGAYLDGHYIVAYQDPDGAQKMMRFNVSKRDQVEPIDVVADALHVSVNDGKLYLADGKDVYLWANEAGARLGCSWESKLFNFPAPLSMSVAKVDAAFDDPFVAQVAEDIAHNDAILGKPWTARGSLGGGAFGSVSVGGSLLRRVDPESAAHVVFSIIDEAGGIVFTKAVTSKEPFRLPGGFKLGACAYGISTNIPVRGFAVSTSMRSLLGDGGLA